VARRRKARAGADRLFCATPLGLQPIASGMCATATEPIEAPSQRAETKTALSIVESKSRDEDKKISSCRTISGDSAYRGRPLRGESFFRMASPTRSGRLRVRFGVDGS